MDGSLVGPRALLQHDGTEDASVQYLCRAGGQDDARGAEPLDHKRDGGLDRQPFQGQVASHCRGTHLKVHSNPPTATRSRSSLLRGVYDGVCCCVFLLTGVPAAF